ncbi:MAG: flagellar hook-associated protein FlgK [Candidatus Margulisbacteria bacterium]|nr:flagellar hook-associated protein FlgK [Candidatus Margulisiibacteriota bacterium]
MSGGIEIARKALQANAYVLDTIGNNIANANTPGYSRQKVSLKPSESISIAVNNVSKPFASLGTGVSVYNVERMRNEFFDAQMRNVLGEHGSWTQQSVAYSTIESIFNEPSDFGVSAKLEAFFDSWHAVQQDPSDSGARVSVISTADQLAKSLQTTRSSLHNLQRNLNEDVPLKIKEANSLISRLSDLNTQIVKAGASGSSTSLKDERTRLTNDLVQLIDADYYEDSRGVATIAVNGVILLSESESSFLEAKMTTESGEAKYGIFLEDTLRGVDIAGGEIYGLMQARDEGIVGFIDKLNQIASVLIEKVNQIHRAGYDLQGNPGGNLFEGTSANDIKVSDFITRNGSLIAASSTISNVEGNGNNALAISQLRDQGVFDSGTTSISKFYQNLISNLGVNTLAATNYLQTNKDIISQLNNQIAEVSGVSIDEEMADMVRFQHAYQASAKYLSVIQQVLDTLINMV